MRGSEAPLYLLESTRLQDILNIGWVIWPAHLYGPLEDILELPTDVRAKFQRAMGTQTPDGRIS